MFFSLLKFFCRSVSLFLFSLFSRDEIEDEQYLFDGVKLTEPELREMR